RPARRLARSLQNGDFPDESPNSPVALVRLVPRDPSQHVVRDAFYESRSKQRCGDKPVASILAVRQSLYLRSSVAHCPRRYQGPARRRNEFLAPAEVSRANFCYRRISSGPTLRTCGDVAAGAGSFVEMDAKPHCGGHSPLERCPRLKELFLVEQGFLCIETLR